MQMSRIRLISMVFAALAAVGAWAQTTQPAESSQPAAGVSTEPSVAASLGAPSWQNFVSRFAAALIDSTDADALDAMLAEDVTVHRFDRSEREGINRLRDRASGQTAVSVRAYVGVPPALAADLATDFRDAPVSEPLKRVMIPGGDAELKRANQTSTDWIAATLGPNSADLVGVIVLVAPESATDRSTAEAVTPPLFVLLKAEPSAGGHFRTKLIIYGDPRK